MDIPEHEPTNDRPFRMTPAPIHSSEPSNDQLPTVTSITGILPGQRWLTRPVTVNIQEDDGEFVVTEPLYHMHASAPTIADAIEAFRHIFSGYLDILEEEEHNLGPQLHKQLDYLRNIIKTR